MWTGLLDYQELIVIQSHVTYLYNAMRHSPMNSQKIFLGSAFEEKEDLLILYMYHSLGAVEQFIIVGCMLIAISYGHYLSYSPHY